LLVVPVSPQPTEKIANATRHERNVFMENTFP
jgi:hypothetical protein